MKPRKWRILLVGEGNFSFTVALLGKLEHTEIIATCSQEQNPYSTEQQKYMSQADAMGARVLTNVDARCLHLHPNIYTDKFDCIIFNFPHVGGKMKICRNRKLVKDFFTSASQLLAPKGEIWMTLCKGQGGTPADSLHRRKDDTWKVVEMAAYGGLVLTAVRSFKAAEYAGYNPIGSGAKPFSIEGALTHIFEWRGFPIVHDLGHQHDYMVECIRAAFSKDSHPLHMVGRQIEDLINDEQDSISIISGRDWGISEVFHCKANIKCRCMFVLRKSTSPLDPPFNHVVELRELNDAKDFLSKALNFATVLTDKCCQAMCECKDMDSTVHLLCGNLCVGTITIVDACQVLSIKLEQTAMAQLNMVDWHQLLPLDCEESLYPEEHWMDSSFWIPEEFSETRFLKVARLAAGDSLHTLFLLDRYKDAKSGRTSMCYRFCYRSLNRALTREAAKCVHEVVRTAAEQQLGVELR
ncbi:ferredoxin-fold anticodon-binding domain-containing protein 1-like isoform X2 [Ornithodoros turicata]|uniref:ferredoxin-fold anticodon-binding domain-containing protein 1-like isoform X2 n=1 Tax=Ornithodoros turicata TaxID=34597 RepID=UPI00313871CF